MTYQTNTINSANPGPALYAVLETIMLGQGWTLEDTVTIGARTHKILKSAAAGNSRGLDWYLDINYPTTGVGTWMMTPYEGYTPAGDTGLRGPYSANDTTFEAVNYSRYGATQQALESGFTTSTSYTGLMTTLVAVAFVYRVLVSRDRVAVNVSNQGNFLHYAGFYTPTAAALAQQGASCFPLIVCRIASGGTAQSSTSAASVTAALTRMPKYPDLSATWHGGNGWGNSVQVTYAQQVLGGVGGLFVHPGTGEIVMTQMEVLMGWSNVSVWAAHVGFLDGIYIAYVTSSAAQGDTMTNGGDTFVMLTSSSNLALLMKQV